MMKETKRKGVSSSGKPKRSASASSKQQQQQQQLSHDHPGLKEAVRPAAAAAAVLLAEPAVANLRAVMNAHGAGLLGVLGQQMNAHLNSLAAFEGASRTLTFQCRNMAMEVGKLLEALERYQGAHTDALVQATLLRGLVAEFAQHVHNAQALGITN